MVKEWIWDIVCWLSWKSFMLFSRRLKEIWGCHTVPQNEQQISNSHRVVSLTCATGKIIENVTWDSVIRRLRGRYIINSIQHDLQCSYLEAIIGMVLIFGSHNWNGCICWWEALGRSWMWCTCKYYVYVTCKLAFAGQAQLNTVNFRINLANLNIK